MVRKLNKIDKDPKLLPNHLRDINPIRSRFKQLSDMNKEMMDKKNNKYDTDDYLSDLLKVLKIKSTVVGVGGAGNNTVSRLNDIGLEGTETVNINTDAHDLYYSNSDKKLLIGKETCNGLGSGNDPFIGAKAAEEDVCRVENSLNADIVFITCGLGGGTGTGAAPIIAREAKKKGSIVVSFCTLPFNSEGSERRLRAKKGLYELSKFSDTIIPLPNNNLVNIVPNVPLLTGFKIMDEILIRSIREVVSLINNCGLINIDFADVKRVLQKSGKYPSGLIGITESLGSASDLITKSKLAIRNPLLELETKDVDKCLVSVTGSHKLTLSKVDNIVTTITNEISNGAQVKFGTAVDPNIGKKIRIMVLGRGPISPYVKAAIDNDSQFFNNLMN
ncbi:MAG: cell division protein FtsZ [Candidatus Lokiarchaeota archaeon]|nr:cell division protein FtsZ [Candidatus Lokiarchaeota archaeon]MBD3198982.1 cell division protein FtsZ [Candidatus Lokiarchaeota archaeon]